MTVKPNSPVRSPWLFDIEPFEITDGIYYVGNTNVSSHLFDTGEGLLLLDTGYPQTGYLLLESIRMLGFNPHDLRWILHTHAHSDHFGATRMLVEKYGCRTYMPEADLEFLTSRPEFNYCAEMDMPYEPPYDTFFNVDVPVYEGDQIQFGNVLVTAYSAAGHTPGTMAYTFQMPSGLIAGMHGGIGLNTLTDEYTSKHNLGSEWRDAFKHSLKSLKGIHVDIVLGNHPKQTKTFEKQQAKTGECNPFIDAGEWDRFLDEVLVQYTREIQS